MSIKNRKEFSKEEVQYAIKNSMTMGGAAKLLKVDWRTFRNSAEKYGLYKPTDCAWKQRYALKDILGGKYPQYPTSKLSRRLVKEGYKERKCERCGITEWNDEYISFELNHRDGDSSNHSLKNLELLCPNCHSQTDTFKNKRGNKTER